MKTRRRSGAKSLSSKAYQAIQELMVSERLLVDIAMSEAALAKRLGLSRTPVREAVRQMVQEGLLEQTPRYGTIIRKIDRRDLSELYQVREALESHAAACAAERLTDRQLTQLRILVEAMGEIGSVGNAGPAGLMSPAAVQREMGVDKAFHMLILEAAGNRRLMKIAADTRMVSDLFRLHLNTMSRRIVDQTIGFHERILAALQARDAAKASAAMAEHIRAGLIEAMNHYDDLKLSNGADPESSLNDLPSDLRQKLSEVR